MTASFGHASSHHLAPQPKRKKVQDESPKHTFNRKSGYCEKNAPINSEGFDVLKVPVVDDDNEVHGLISEKIMESSSDFELLQLYGETEFHDWLQNGVHTGEAHLFLIDLQIEEETW